MTMYEGLLAGRRNRELREAIQAGALNYTYKGFPVWKDPFDIALYQMLLWREKPKTIIEIGTGPGGMALWLRDMQLVMCIDPQIVVSVDLHPQASTIPGLVFIRGDGLQLGETFDEAWLAEMARPLLVIEDSAHEPEVTLAVMRFFHPWLRPGEIIVVEDGNAEELYPGRHKRGGPLAGVEDFMAEHGADYVRAAEYCDFFGHNVTWSPDGYWRRR